MILDDGFCSIYAATDIAEPGNMPIESLTLKYQSWYGELNFETAPINQTGLQEDVEISARVRVIQNKGISNHDIAVLSVVLPPPPDARRFEIIRAYHGVDDESGELISDLSLRKVVQQYVVAGIP